MLIKLYRNLSAPPFSRPVIICTTLGVFLLDVNIVLNFVEDTFFQGNYVSHNVNGSQSAYSQNPESFSCDYDLDTCSHTFNIPGTLGIIQDYKYWDNNNNFSYYL